VKNRRLFSGCDNKMMAVMDADSGKVVASPAIGEGVDANGFDPATQLAFASNGEGTLTVVHEDSPDNYTVVENVPPGEAPAPWPRPQNSQHLSARRRFRSARAR